MLDKVFKQILADLKANADPVVREGGRRFFKEPIVSHGMKAAVMRPIIKKASASLKGVPKEKLFSLCEKLWQTGSFEESIIACELAYERRDCFVPDDFFVFESWIAEYVNNWASCDTLCNHTVGTFITQHPEFIKRLKGWALSENRWVKRAAAVSLIIPARDGLFLKEIFQIADKLIKDKDDLVQKGFGWMLKAASEAHQQAVFDYLMSKKEVMPHTAFRYALEKMPKELRQKAMIK